MGNGCGRLSAAAATELDDDDVDDFENMINDENISNNNGAVWRHELTLTEARKCFEADGTVPVGCSDEMLELRMYISDPALLRGLVKHCSSSGNNVMILRRWVDMMSFKYVSNSASELKVSTGYDLYFKYLDPTSAGIRRVLCDPKIVATIERDLREAAMFNGKYGQGVTMRTDGAGIVRNSLFDEIYFADMASILNNIYLPLKADPKHQEAVTKFKSQYNQIHVKDFEYMETLGHGGFGMVVHCKKKSTGVHYAMKIQTKDGAINNCDGDFARVTIEKEALVLCNHPFITNLLYAFQNEQLIIMVMSLAAGSLAEFAKEFEGGVLAEEYVVFYTAEVLLALNHIHHLGMIYRDMKPGNILLMEDGHVKLADLGGVVDVGNVVSGYHTQAHDGLFAAVDMNVRDAENSSSVLNMSRSHSHQQMSMSQSNSSSAGNSVASASNSADKHSPRYKVAGAPTAKDIKRAYTYFGTSGYVAPEVIRTLISGESQRGYTHAVDFFSLGVTMYRLLTAEYPFEFKTTQMENYARSFNYRPLIQRSNGSYAASPDCRDLMEKLLVGEEKKRLGYGRSGCSKIKKHPLFKNISWLLLTQKKVQPPPIPIRLQLNMANGGHLSVNAATKKETVYGGFFHMLVAVGHAGWLTRSLMTAEEQVHFRSWDFVSGEALDLEIMHTQLREREAGGGGGLGGDIDGENATEKTPAENSVGGFFASLLRGTNFDLTSTAVAPAPKGKENSSGNNYTVNVNGGVNGNGNGTLSGNSILINGLHSRSLNMGGNEADSYMSSVQMVDTAAQMLRTLEAQVLKDSLNSHNDDFDDLHEAEDAVEKDHKDSEEEHEEHKDEKHE